MMRPRRPLAAPLLLLAPLLLSAVCRADDQSEQYTADWVGEYPRDKLLLPQSSRPVAAAAAVNLAAWPWYNHALSVDARAEALLQAMTTQEKVLQLQTEPVQAVPRLGVQSFGWWVECLHGLRTGAAGDVKAASGVSYPMNIGWAAAFDDALAYHAASEIGDAMRAMYNKVVREGQLVPLFTNCFGPHVHIVRDPRWGRLCETFGEDPLLSRNYASAFVRGLQGSNGTYLKVGATCKHFIGNDLESWKGTTRYTIDVRPSARDIRDTWMVPFEGCVEAKAQSFMCSYNRYWGTTSCASPQLLNGLRGYGWDGHVTTDCNALKHATNKPPKPYMNSGNLNKTFADAFKAGTDLVCKESYSLIPSDLTAAELDRATRRVLRARVRMGHFNLPSAQPFAHLTDQAISTPQYAATALELGRKSIVLLKNQPGALPLRPAALKNVTVVGPFANVKEYLLGKYYGATPSEVVTPLAAIRAALPGATVSWGGDAKALQWTAANEAADVARCQAADACILFLGTRTAKKAASTAGGNPYDQPFEGEGADRETLRLNAYQDKLWKLGGLCEWVALATRTNKPLVVVLVHNGPIDVSELHASPRVAAILSAWYPGQLGSLALADILFGKVSPSGRTPLSWYKESYTQMPMTDIRMRASAGYPGRTYRYYKPASWAGGQRMEAPLYEFGHGLGYTTFSTSVRSLLAYSGAAHAMIDVRNTGSVPADTAILAFMRYVGPSPTAGPGARTIIYMSGCNPAVASTDLVKRLVGYQRTRQLAPGASATVAFKLDIGGGTRSAWAGFGDPAPPCGAYALRFGVDQPEIATVVLSSR